MNKDDKNILFVWFYMIFILTDSVYDLICNYTLSLVSGERCRISRKMRNPKLETDSRK